MMPDIVKVDYIAEHLTKDGTWVRLEDTFTSDMAFTSFGIIGDPLPADPVERVICLLKKKNRHGKLFRITKLETHRTVLQTLEKDWKV